MVYHCYTNIRSNSKMYNLPLALFEGDGERIPKYWHIKLNSWNIMKPYQLLFFSPPLGYHILRIRSCPRNSVTSPNLWQPRSHLTGPHSRSQFWMASWDGCLISWTKMEMARCLYRRDFCLGSVPPCSNSGSLKRCYVREKTTREIRIFAGSLLDSPSIANR